MVESQKGFVAIIGLIVAVAIGLTVGTYVYRNHTKDPAEPATSADIKGSFYYDSGGLRFLVPAYENGEISHMYTLSFSNEVEAIKRFGIDTAELAGKSSEGVHCNIMSETLATITVTGYSTAQAEADWAKNVPSEVTLKSVITPSASSVMCATS